VGAGELVVPAALLLVALAITAWVFLPVFRGAEAARRHVGTHRLAIGTMIVVLLLNALLTRPIEPQLRSALASGFTTNTFLAAALATESSMLLVLYARLVVPGAVTWAELGLRAVPLGKLLRFGLAVGFGGFVLTVLIGTALSQFGLRANQVDEFRFVRREGLGSLLLMLLSVAVLAPVVEELFFRGFLFGLYRRRQPVWVAYLVAGLVFSLLHVQPSLMNPSQMAGLGVGVFVLGTLLAWVYQSTGSLLPGMLAHAINNATGLVVLYFAIG
jgi:membrane protease YdiL (CAAX protease family)